MASEAGRTPGGPAGRKLGGPADRPAGLDIVAPDGEAVATEALGLHGRDLTSGSLHGDIWFLAIPMILEIGTVN
ncbi:MAG: hypothetical protein PVH41_17930, partial [Anaerolineae bacterium]